ncbi:MAG: hypothetical protein AAB401_21530, partial [Acidobacteriota bacterium]
EAVTAYRDALLVYTHVQLPQDWAMTQNNLGMTLRSQGEGMAGDEGVKLLAEAVAAYRNALQVYTREHLPLQWATTQNNLGAALKSQGERMTDEKGVKLLAEAVITYRSALQVRTREHLPQQWAATQNDLGSVLWAQGKRMRGEESMKLLTDAVAAYHNALLVYNHEHLPQQWATTQNNLGLALMSQSERMAGNEGKKLLADAVAAYHNALQVRTREHLLQQWAETQVNLGDAYYFLSEWDKAAECYVNCLALYPNDKITYQRLSGIRHDISFEYEAAFKLHQQWLIQFPDDFLAMTAFTENHFTIGRFAECRERLAALLAKPELDAGWKIGLRLIEIASLLALGQVAEVPAKLDLLSAAVAAQPADFKTTWTFYGTLHFIGQNEKLALYREWLRQLFNAVQSENRDAIIKGLSEAKAGFKQ